MKNAVEHAFVFAKQPQLRAEDFPGNYARRQTAPVALRGQLRSLEDFEREIIKATLEATRYKIGRCAEILGISRKTLLEKRKKFGLL